VCFLEVAGRSGVISSYPRPFWRKAWHTIFIVNIAISGGCVSSKAGSATLALTPTTPALTHLDGVGDGNAHSGGAQGVGEGHGQQRSRNDHDGAKQVAPEGQPQVGLRVRNGAKIMASLKTPAKTATPNTKLEMNRYNNDEQI